MKTKMYLISAKPNTTWWSYHSTLTQAFASNLGYEVIATTKAMYRRADNKRGYSKYTLA